MNDPDTRLIECPIAFNVTPTKDQESTPAIRYELLIDGKPLDDCSDEEVRECQQKLHDFIQGVETASLAFIEQPKVTLAEATAKIEQTIDTFYLSERNAL